ncbi:MAG: hypothetical protein ABSB59_23935 [Streptosporangiaceae bacterium]|jgi:hypothetical protein
MSHVSLAARVRPPAERALRVRRRLLQTPVVRFEHQGTGRTVTVVGVVHIGQAAYYRRLNTVLARLEAAGALVCYEYVAPAADTEWSAVDPAERDGWNATVATNREISQAACRYLGWVLQAEAMAYAETWRNVDMTEAEFVQRGGALSLGGLDLSVKDLFGERSQDRQDVLLGHAAAALMRLVALDRYRLLRHVARSDSMRVMLDQRNERALASLPSDRDAVLIWGANHLPGLAAGLQQAGYRRQAGAWLSVGELPPLRTSAQAIWGVLREDRPGSAVAPGQDPGSAGSSGM